VDAFEGTFSVPENRNAAETRDITLTYVRFAATGDKPGAPIIYLAGGPGGSGIRTAQGPRFPLFMAMREFGDVIALDQRGTGASNDLEGCRTSVYVPEKRPVSDEEFIGLYRESIGECLETVAAGGADIYGYTTEQSALDLDDLRRALGAKKISLWGISYGSHLTFAAIKEMDAHLDKVVIASAEGLNQTVKMPARTDAYIGRLQEAINQDPAAKAMFPDINGMIARVLARLEETPLELDIPQQDGSTAKVLVEKRSMQMISTSMIADPQNAARLLFVYLGLDNGDTSGLVQLIQYFHEPNEPISWYPMSMAMDIASGITEERLADVETQAETSLFADFLNFPMPQLLGAIPNIDLGDDFRQDPVSDVPLLLLSGTLDGRTYPESQKETVTGMSDVTIVTVENAGHNLFMTSPAVTTAIQQFMRGDEVEAETITVALPDFTNPW
jgi:pimeloyl-ACP methyl ester carboxylesterase